MFTWGLLRPRTKLIPMEPQLLSYYVCSFYSKCKVNMKGSGVVCLFIYVPPLVFEEKRGKHNITDLFLSHTCHLLSGDFQLSIDYSFFFRQRLNAAPLPALASGRGRAAENAESSWRHPALCLRLTASRVWSQEEFICSTQPSSVRHSGLSSATYPPVHLAVKPSQSCSLTGSVRRLLPGRDEHTLSPLSGSWGTGVVSWRGARTAQTLASDEQGPASPGCPAKVTDRALSLTAPRPCELSLGTLCQRLTDPDFAVFADRDLMLVPCELDKVAS